MLSLTPAAQRGKAHRAAATHSLTFTMQDNRSCSDRHAYTKADADCGLCSVLQGGHPMVPVATESTNTNYGFTATILVYNCRRPAKRTPLQPANPPVQHGRDITLNMQVNHIQCAYGHAARGRSTRSLLGPDCTAGSSSLRVTPTATARNLQPHPHRIYRIYYPVSSVGPGLLPTAPDQQTPATHQVQQIT